MQGQIAVVSRGYRNCFSIQSAPFPAEKSPKGMKKSKNEDVQKYSSKNGEEENATFIRVQFQFKSLSFVNNLDKTRTKIMEKKRGSFF